MSRHSAAEALAFLDQRTKVFFYNVLLIFLTTLPAYLFRRRAFYRLFIAVFWLGLGAANGVILANRVTPLTGPDLLMISDALRVSGKYFSKVEIIAVIAAILIGVAAIVRYFFTSSRFGGKMRRRYILPVLLLCAVGFYGLTQLFLQAKLLSSYFSNIAYAYLDYGFPYSLSVTVFDTGISEPNNYSEQLVASVLREEGEVPETELTEDMPNIVVVQLESFFDPTRVQWLRFSEDPVPNWHRLTNEYTSGYYTVPTVGAGTVNTEFETLTGMSLRFFGPGEYPYKGILLKETCESAAYNLASLGYTSHAIHNNEANFYGRRKVYSYLGFNSFTSAEYMNTQNDVNENDWMRDRNLTPCIVDALDSTSNRDFVFTVSVQPHGSYPTEPVLTDPAITVTGAESDGENCAWEYFVNQLYEEDQFVADLIDALNERDEPTIILFYGDHLPTMNLSDRDLKGNGTIFDTNYLLWSSFDLERRTNKLRSYQAMAEVMDRIGIHTGTMFTYQQTMKTKSDYLYDMQVLQYDILYGNKYVYGRTNPYSTTVLAMGVKPIRVDKIQKISPESSAGSYYISGQNFTQSCRFQVNGELVDTMYLDGGTLLVRGITLEKGDWVNVAVESNSSSKEILSTSNTLVYGSGRLLAENG